MGGNNGIRFKDGSPLVKGTKEFHVEENKGHRIGFMGFAGLEWIETLNDYSVEDLDFEQPEHCADRLGKMMREELGCDFIISLNHMRIREDTE